MLDVAAAVVPRRIQSEAAGTYAVELTDDEILARAEAIMLRQLERGQAMTSPEIAGRYCALRLRGLEREVFSALFLDNRHRVLGYEELFQGTLDGAEVHPREVVKAALRHNAAAAIFAHNHPSGNPEPSAADRVLTTRLKEALALVDVRVLDHFIIGDGAPVSMSARGLV